MVDNLSKDFMRNIRMDFKFGFIGEFRLAQTPVGSDALVAPKAQTFCFLMGKGIV